MHFSRGQIRKIRISGKFSLVFERLRIGWTRTRTRTRHQTVQEPLLVSYAGIKRNKIKNVENNKTSFKYTYYRFQWSFISCPILLNGHFWINYWMSFIIDDISNFGFSQFFLVGFGIWHFCGFLPRSLSDVSA